MIFNQFLRIIKALVYFSYCGAIIIILLSMLGTPFPRGIVSFLVGFAIAETPGVIILLTGKPLWRMHS